MTIELIDKKIGQLKKSETITKQLLSELSREILVFVIENRDVRPVNHLLGDKDGYALSPVNWRFACKYFLHFLPFSSNFDEVKDCINNGGNRSPLRFKKISPRSFEAKCEQIAIWLADDKNDIWVWSNSINLEEKPVDWFKRLTGAVEKASDKGGLSAVDIMAAVMAAGIDAEILIKAISEALPKEEDKAAA